MSSPTPSPAKHERHYATRLLTFKVENKLFRIPDNVLRGSPHFSDMLDSEQIGEPGEGVSDEHPIVLHGVTAKEMESFLDVPLIRLVDANGTGTSLDFDQLSAAFRLAAMWSFDRVTEYAIRQIDERFPDPVDRLVLSFNYDVKKWRLPAYRILCDRDQTLTGTEGDRLGGRRVAAICRIRERKLLMRSANYQCWTCANCLAGYGSVNCLSSKTFSADVFIRAEGDLQSE